MAHDWIAVRSDRAALEAFGDRLTSFRARTPEFEATMEAILGKLNQVDEGAKKATRLSEIAAELDAQLTRVTGRIQVIDKVEGRINTLHVLTADIDRKLAEQLSRRSELDTLKSQCDGVIAQMLRRAAEGRGGQLAAGQGASDGEQKAVIDHVAEKLARLEFMMQEAQSTLRTLQYERELAERIEESIKQLRTRGTAAPERKPAVSA